MEVVVHSIEKKYCFKFCEHIRIHTGWVIQSKGKSPLNVELTRHKVWKGTLVKSAAVQLAVIATVNKTLLAGTSHLASFSEVNTTSHRTLHTLSRKGCERCCEAVLADIILITWCHCHVFKNQFVNCSFAKLVQSSLAAWVYRYRWGLVHPHYTAHPTYSSYNRITR